MKKILFMAVLTAFALTLKAQTSVETLFSKYSKEMHTESVKVGPLLLSFARLCADDSDDAAMLSHINSVRVLSLEECSDRVKENFRKDALNLKSNGMELLMEVSDDEDLLNIYIRRNGDHIKEFLLVNVGEDPCLVKMSGSILESEISNLVAQNMD